MSEDLNQVLILKRNDEEEKRNNYKKIYNLSLIDSIKNITQDEKMILLSTIKKILLCTNKYIDEFNKNYLLEFVELVGIYFFLYLIIFLPIIRFIIMTEEQVLFTKEFTLYKKFKIFVRTHLMILIVKIFELYYSKTKFKKFSLYYARNELKKIKNIFIISIDDKSFDLKIKRNNQVNENESNSKDDFYQYVICYPKYFDNIDTNIITPFENALFYITKVAETKIFEINLLEKYKRSIILIFEIISFYYLTLARIKMYYIIIVILSIIDDLIGCHYNIKRHENSKAMEYLIFRKHMKSGYFINMCDDIIEIFKLNKNYEDEEKSETDFLDIHKKIEEIHGEITWI